MVFASPFWLLGLLPWALLAAWVLRGRRIRVKVPFLDLWRGPVPLEIPKRGWRTPPIWLALVLLGVLCAVLGAARPVIRSIKLRGDREITIVVDCGMSMSAQPRGTPRFQSAARVLDEKLKGVFAPLTEVRLLCVPGELRRATVRNWFANLAGEPVTAIDTSEMLGQVVHEQLSDAKGHVILISDQSLNIADDSLIQIAPFIVSDRTATSDVGIVHIAARTSPAAQVMVRLMNNSTRTSTTVRVSSGDWSRDRTFDLPESVVARDFFFDAPAFGASIEARLLDSDDQPANDARWLVREEASPRIEPHVSLTPELARMLGVYSHARPPSSESTRISLVASIDQLPADAPGIVVASLAASQVLHGPLIVASHPITKDVNWQVFPDQLRVASDAPTGWQPLVQAQGKMLVAARNAPVRQVWVGFDFAGWSASTDYVVFWANVFSWAGAGEERYVEHPLSDFQADWKLTNPPATSPTVRAGQWPGLYRTPDNRLHALNAPDMKISPPPKSMESQLDRIRVDAPSGTPLTLPLLLLALAAIAGACLTWKDESPSRAAPIAIPRD